MSFDLPGIFAAGLLTFASPCILPLVPVYLALLGGASADELARGRRSGRAIVAALAFVLGLSLVFLGLGLAATFVGRALVAHRALLLQLGGVAVFLFGLKHLGFLQIPWLEREYRPLLGGRTGGGFAGGLVLGATFGLGWTPCIGPVLGSVLTFTAGTATSPLTGALFLGVYALGLSLPLLVVAAVAPLALRWVRSLQRHMQKMQVATGALLSLVGLLLVTDNVDFLDPTRYGRPQQPPLAAAATPPEAAACAEPSRTAGACGMPETEIGGEQQVLPTGPAMVEFVSNRCPICLRMAPVVAAAERDCAGHEVAVRRIQVDAPGGQALARRYGVLGVPTFVFLDGAGGEVARLVGEQSLDALAQTLSVLAGKECAGFRALPGSGASRSAPDAPPTAPRPTPPVDDGG